MSPLASVAPGLLARARSDQVATLYGQWHRTTLSMVLGAAILCTVLWGQVAPAVMACWVVVILLNQAWRGVLARAYRRAAPPAEAAPRWGRRWAVGSALAGTLWGAAAHVMYPTSPAYEALLIVCLFGVVLGGLNLTAVYKPSFYGFALCALVPLIARVAQEGDAVHVHTALVMTVVLAFLLGFGHHLNDLLTHSLANRYENVDLVVELQAQTQSALEARGAAETANRAKSQFLAAASHDLRQPLHALGLFAAALQARAREPELKPLVTSMLASVDALEALFAQLLDLSRLEAGALSPERAALRLQPLFERLRADFAPQAAAHGLRLDFAPTTISIASDPVLLERILRNLIANALRYTSAGGVLVGARRRGAAARIDVIDSGIGIAPEMRERVFDEFVQGAPAPRQATAGRGMGLGLAIVRRLAALLDHPLELASVPGQGSRFSVAVPRVPRVPPRRHRSEELPSALPAPDAHPATVSFAGRRVAVIDDDPSVVAAMRTLFTAWGASVAGGEDVAALAADALAQGLARRGRTGAFDLIVADLRLANGGCGLAAVQELQALSGGTAPALIVSGDTGVEAHAAVATAGFTLLSKPVLAGTLKTAAAAALDAAAAHRSSAPAGCDHVV